MRIYGWADGIKKQWVDTDTKQVEQALGQMIESFLLNHVAEREREERRRQEEERRTHLARRRKMAELRNKRETDRLEYLQWIADTRREVADLSDTIALVPNVADLPKAYQRMMEWARARLQSLEAQTTIERIQATLEERELYADPDPLDDPEGDPPPKMNSWDD
ncbi:hypothetical protein [Rhizobium leguminosarum]|uniref:hypothetical protein n=1 Tax=Rhizobium leguminosarum TaxID=384 RepID=UPI001C92AA33|nr:hypothetical protein [Rhizobium leguminosarum]MBY2907284.1 hypothetical protein [Rhizobium leguminosarum]